VLCGVNILLRSSLYNSLGGVIRLAVGVVTIPVLIRTLGLEEYGVWTLASSIIAIVMLAESGLSFATTFFVSQSIAKGDTEDLLQVLSITFSTILVASTLISVLLWLSVAPILSVFPKLTSSQILVAGSSLHLGAFVVLSRLLQQVLVGVEQAYQSYGWINLLGTAQTLLLNSGMIFIAFHGGRSVELMKWQLLVSVLLLICHIYLVKFSIRSIRFRFIWNYVKFLDVLKYSMSTWVASLGGVLFGQVDRLIVGSILGIETLGTYAAITNATVQINSLSAMPIQPIVPVLSGFTRELNVSKTAVKAIVRKAFEANCMVALGMGVLFLAFDSQIVSFLVGGNLNYLNEFRFATIIYAAYSMNAAGYYVAFGTNSVKMCMLIQLFSGAFSLMLIYLGSSLYGLSGAIAGNSGYCFVWLLTFLGFGKFGITHLEWMTWIFVPVISFASLCLSIVVIPDNFIFKFIACTLCALSMVIWFMSRKLNVIYDSDVNPVG
jgi:O-antigen/teichoic acid export membrane protein